MADSINVGGGSRPRRGATVSAGVPESSAELRMAELERRLAQLEGEPTLRDRSRRLMDRVVPPEATRHFRNAGREHLMGIRSIVDHWISRIDDAETHASDSAGRHSIEID
jgi:hypothetical protein